MPCFPRLPLLAMLLMLAPGLARAQPAGESAMPSAFTPAQRAEIVQIVRRALQRDPSILRDAVTALEASDSVRQTAAVARQKRMLLHDPADPVAGNPAGRVTIVEFYDTRCPYCRTMLPVMDRLLARNPDVRLVFKDIPILGPASLLGAQALLAAQRQGGYLKLQHALMGEAAAPTRASIRADAERLGLDGARLVRAMDDPAIAARIQANLALAHDLGVNGTPAFVVGRQLVPGAISFSDMQKLVAAARKG
ncbi:MAG TPA: DsbA family protein [Acetobacteraceae bacterium]|nr:DsbA family protein [Acetobacteraceae bacterium]